MFIPSVPSDEEDAAMEVMGLGPVPQPPDQSQPEGGQQQLPQSEQQQEEGGEAPGEDQERQLEEVIGCSKFSSNSRRWTECVPRG